MTTTADASTPHGSDETQVLTFGLGEQEYCVGIDYVAEIVDGGEMTALPNTADHVEGVMDLRGRTTTIVNPCKLLNTNSKDLLTDGGSSKEYRLIVLDADAIGAETPTGWLVSEVNEVKSIADDRVDADPIGSTDLLRGVTEQVIQAGDTPVLAVQR